MTHVLEEHAQRVDPTIVRLPLSTVRDVPVLRRYFAGFGVPPWDVWAYAAPAEGPWPERRLVAVFKRHPVESNRREADPAILCLDGPRKSPHRYAEAEGCRLCVWYPDDPPERRWHVGDGLVRLFDLARLHVLAEHVWRKRGGRDEDWPIEWADHGPTLPAESEPSLALPAELPNLGPRVGAPWR